METFAHILYIVFMAGAAAMVWLLCLMVCVEIKARLK